MLKPWKTCLLLILACGWCVTLSAASFIGKVVSVSDDGREIVVEGAKGKATFELSSKVLISAGGKKLAADDLAAGTSVTVYTDDQKVVTSISVRSTGSSPAKKPPVARAPKAKPEEPEEDAPAARSARVETDPSDWPCFDGAHRDNISRETGLMKSWPERGPSIAWTAGGLGEGFASVSVADGVVYTYGNVGSSETVTALDLATGKQLWQTPTGSASRLSAGNGPRGTPTVDGDRVYALGGNGDLTALEAKTGKRVWQKNILQEFQGENIQWGICESVLIDGDRLICTPGGRTGTMVSLSKRNGQVQWRCVVPGGVQAGYASAIAADVGNVRQYIQFTARGVIGVRADNGELLWANDASANGTANCSSPLYADGMVFSASGYDKGGAMLRLQSRGRATEARFAYHTRDMKNHHGGMVLIDGHVYGSNDPGILVCLDLATGRVKWQNRSVGKGSITAAEGLLYVRSENGPVALVSANPDSYEELGRFEPAERSGANTWPHPVVAQGKLFLRDQNKLEAYDIRAR